MSDYKALARAAADRLDLNPLPERKEMSEENKQALRDRAARAREIKRQQEAAR